MGDQSVRSVRSSLSSGALAGLASALALQPLDVIKTRLQEAGVGAPWRRRLAKVVASTYSVEGIAGFWRGTRKHHRSSTNVRNSPDGRAQRAGRRGLLCDPQPAAVSVLCGVATGPAPRPPPLRRGDGADEQRRQSDGRIGCANLCGDAPYARHRPQGPL